MANGRIQQIGTPEEIYETPANAFVANFVGRVNLVEGRIVAAEAGQCTVRLAGGAVFTGRAPSPPTSGSTVKVAIRPEAFRFLGPETLSQHNCLVGRLEARRFLGSTVQLLVATAVDGEFTIEHPAEPGARASGEGPQVGDVVRIGCCADRVRIFAEPAASGG
jgi:ABC-type Fe3+/spermidine/putrescine transport system ATPase subunit